MSIIITYYHTVIGPSQIRRECYSPLVLRTRRYYECTGETTSATELYYDIRRFVCVSARENRTFFSLRFLINSPRGFSVRTSRRRNVTRDRSRVGSGLCSSRPCARVLSGDKHGQYYPGPRLRAPCAIDNGRREPGMYLGTGIWYCWCRRRKKPRKRAQHAHARRRSDGNRSARDGQARKSKPERMTMW